MSDNGHSDSAAAAAVVRFRVLGAIDLRDARGDELRAVLVQPRRLALLAYLALSGDTHPAAAGTRLHRRDSLLALFWPESTTDAARNALRQALHFLRQALGARALVTRGDDEVGVDPDVVWCDVRALDQALVHGRLDDALALYRGHLLEGFHVSGVASEFDQWLDGERERLRRRVVQAATALVDDAERAGNLALAARRTRDLLRLDPSSESALRRLMSLLDRTGDRAEALRTYDDFARRLAAELEAEPAPETAALAERVRAGGDRPPRAERAAVVDVAAHAEPPPAPRPRGVSRRWRVALGGALVVALAVAAALRLTAAARGSTAHVLLAVGAVDDRTGQDSLGASRVLRDLLATELARVRGVDMVSQARIQQLLGQLGVREETHATLADAARRAGARELLEGTLYRHAPNALRLDLRRVDVSTGVIRRAYTVEAPDLFALAERVGAQLAGELGQPPPSPRLADVTTTSLVARRFYEEGMRAFYHADRRLALEMFRAALAEDSTFAMAAYAAARTVIFVGDTGALRFAAQAARHAGRTTERERLRIATLWAEMTNDPALVPLADSLASRFPLEPEALLDVGRAHNWAADYPANIAYLRRAIERDSASLAGVAPDTARASPGCTWCDALGDLVAVYLALDSLDAAERTARVFVRRQPRSYNAWSALSEVLESRGREREALDALRRGWGTLAEPPDDRPRTARLHIRAGAFAEADRLLADAAADERAVVRREAAWWRVISLRNQRRLDEALRAARQFAAEAGSPTDPRNRLPEAQVLFEMGRSREAAALFEALTAASLPPPLPDVPNGAPGIAARGLSWNLTHAATAHAAAGDTARLARYVDSVEALGRRSAFGRDRLLHHHLRGLLLMARGDTAAAAAELRRAMTSPTRGYTRTNLELGRALVALGRPREAVAVLRPALHGDLQAGNYYVTHAELHAALARALDAAGEPDSARAHRAWGDGAGGRGRLVAR